MQTRITHPNMDIYPYEMDQTKSDDAVVINSNNISIYTVISVHTRKGSEMFIEKRI